MYWLSIWSFGKYPRSAAREKIFEQKREMGSTSLLPASNHTHRGKGQLDLVPRLLLGDQEKLQDLKHHNFLLFNPVSVLSQHLGSESGRKLCLMLLSASQVKSR